MNILVVGGGGREHALAATLAKSPHVAQILCAPGNAGTAQVGENIPITADSIPDLIKCAQERNVHLTVVGPEAPLCNGIVDQFNEKNLRIFGPSAAAARIEGDKAYAKKLMKSAHVPTAEGRIFTHHDGARDYVATRDTGVVVKAAGLAAGKGVFVCPDPADALLALEKIMVEKTFQEAGNTVVVEELLQGDELSVFALVSGNTIYVLDAAQDHKAASEGDTGPNTGGMGAYTPTPLATEKVMTTIERDVLVPIVDALRNHGAPFNGLLYAGLMLTAGGPKVLEFNCRFGDPETQPLLVRLQSDLLELLDATVDNRLDEVECRWSPKASVCVVMAAQGYPGPYETGHPITGLDIENNEDLFVFHAGTRKRGEHIVSSGGRVLAVTALGDDLPAAKKRAYEGVEQIQFEGAWYRRDISDKALARH